MMTDTFMQMHGVQSYLHQMHLHDNAPPNQNKFHFKCLVLVSDVIYAWLACNHDCMIRLLSQRMLKKQENRVLCLAGVSSARS